MGLTLPLAGPSARPPNPIARRQNARVQLLGVEVPRFLLDISVQPSDFRVRFQKLGHSHKLQWVTVLVEGFVDGLQDLVVSWFVQREAKLRPIEALVKDCGPCCTRSCARGWESH